MAHIEYYCGACDRRLPESPETSCRYCKRITVSWDTDNETREEAFEKWVSMRAYFNEPPYKGKPGSP